MSNFVVSEGYAQFVTENINNFIKDNGKLPSKKELEKFVAIEPLINAFGSWSNALKSLGFVEKDADSIIQELKELRDSKNEIPNIAMITECGINIKPAIKKYGSWSEIKKLLKGEFVTIKPTHKRKKDVAVEKEIIGNEIKSLTDNLGKMPTIKDLKDNKISVAKTIRIFGSWKNAKEELNLNERLVDNIKDKIVSFQAFTIKRPNLSELKDEEIDVTPLIKQYGSWKKACSALNIELYKSDKIKEEIVSLAEHLNRTPHLTDVKNAKIHVEYLLKQGYTWKSLSNELNLASYSEKTYIDAIKELSADIDKTPTIKDMKESGIKISTLLNKYHGWNNVREMIGLPKRSKYTNTEIKEIETTIINIAKRKGGTPTITEVKAEKTKYYALISRYGSWNNALYNMGLQLNNKYTDEAIDGLINNIKDLAIQLGKTPTIKELKENNIAINPLRRKYGSINACYISIGLRPNVLSSKVFDKDSNLAEIQEIVNETGKIPSLRQVKERGIKVHSLIKAYGGSWKNVKAQLTQSLLNRDTEMEIEESEELQQVG